MPHSRQLPRIPFNGKIGVRLKPFQRDQLLRSSCVPPELGHRLHRAPVRKGRLEIRADLPGVEAMITAAVEAPAPDRAAERALDTFVRYLEDLADRFERPAEEDEFTVTPEVIASADGGRSPGEGPQR